MERKLTVIDTRTMSTKVFESNATTVAELKEDLLAQGINPEGMAIQEGLTKTELLSNETILPHDIPWRGTVTNNLVLRLTKQSKNIESGMTRKEVYEKIKDLHLEEAIKLKYNRNYTLVPTEELLTVVNSTEESLEEEDKEQPKLCRVNNILKRLIDVLIDNGVLEEIDLDYIFHNDCKSKKVEGTEDFTSDELEEMFSF